MTLLVGIPHSYFYVFSRERPGHEKLRLRERESLPPVARPEQIPARLRGRFSLWTQHPPAPHIWCCSVKLINISEAYGKQGVAFSRCRRSHLCDDWRNAPRTQKRRTISMLNLVTRRRSDAYSGLLLEPVSENIGAPPQTGELG